MYSIVLQRSIVLNVFLPHLSVFCQFIEASDINLVDTHEQRLVRKQWFDVLKQLHL